MKVGSLEKRSNQPKNEKFNDDCKADHIITKRARLPYISPIEPL